MSKPWSQLPNAHHINDLIDLVQQHPIEFSVAYYKAGTATYDAAYNAAWKAALDAARNAAREAAWNAACDAAGNNVSVAVYSTTSDANLAFVAYDDCAKYLNMSYNQLQVWTELSENPAAILLLPYVKVRELIKAKV